MRVRSRLALHLLTILGLGATAASAYVHYWLLRDPSFVSFCDVNETVSCTTAYLSSYGSLWGVPVAVLGVCWFVGLWLLQIGSRVAGVPQADHVPGYVFALSVPALALALYLAYAAFFVLHAACVLCILTYVSIVGLFIVSGMTTPFSMSTLPARFARDAKTLIGSPVALVLALLFVAGAASALAFFPREVAAAASGSAAAQAAATATVSAAEQAQLEKYLNEAPRSIIPVDAAAAVVIVKFNDYQCPPCRQTYDMYKPLKAKWDKEAPGKVKWVTKDFPLELECNGAIKGGSHQFACEAAAAVRMARQANKGEALEDWIFAHQSGLTLDALKGAARDIGGVQNFDQQYPSVLTEVRGDTALGGVLGVSQTPTFYVNGVKLPPLQPEYLNAAIAHELKRTAK
jgi:uncharacterized membrane protein/protein-disulfide isomerase